MIIALIVLVVLVLWGFLTYNSLVGAKNKCEEAFSTMDVYLKQRFDLIPNLVSTVKGYAKHEAETLEKVISARSGMKSASASEILEQEQKISDTISRISIIAEQYPDLHANENFLDLQGQLKSLETDIANARKYYNGSVRQYNDKIMMIPSNIIANIAHFSKLPLFEVSSSTERENVKVEF